MIELTRTICRDSLVLFRLSLLSAGFGIKHGLQPKEITFELKLGGSVMTLSWH
jgi:hypothetical protein